MCDFQVDIAGLCETAGYDHAFLTERNERLEQLLRDGVATLSEGRLSVSGDARFMVRAVASAFDAYFGAPGRTHSKAA